MCVLTCLFREAGVIVQQLDVVCGDVSIDLSEDVLFGEACLAESLSASKTSRKVGEVHEIPVAESLISEGVYPSSALESGDAVSTVAADVAEASESAHISPTLEAGAAALTTTAIPEPSKGRVVKVPEKVCYPSINCNLPVSLA